MLRTLRRWTHNLATRVSDATAGNTWRTRRADSGHQWSQTRRPRRFVDRPALEDFAREFRQLGGDGAKIGLSAGKGVTSYYPAGGEPTLAEVVVAFPEADLAEMRFDVTARDGSAFGYWGPNTSLYISVGPRGTTISHRGVSYEGLRELEQLVERHTVTYTRRELRRKTPAVEDVDRAASQARRRAEEIERSAGIKGGVFGALAGGAITGAIALIEWMSQR